MSNSDRAAQFAPFAALTGYEELIKETARVTEKKILISSEKKLDISNKLNAELVHVMGRVIILFRKNKENPKIKI